MLFKLGSLFHQMLCRTQAVLKSTIAVILFPANLYQVDVTTSYFPSRSATSPGMAYVEECEHFGCS